MKIVAVFIVLVFLLTGCMSYDEGKYYGPDYDQLKGQLDNVYYQLYGDRHTYQERIICVVIDDYPHFFYADEIKDFYLPLKSYIGENIIIEYTDNGEVDYIYGVELDE